MQRLAGDLKICNMCIYDDHSHIDINYADY